MATSGRISFTVRSILDLPEQDANSIKQDSDHHHSAENYTGSPYRGWIETDRNHYPCEYKTDKNSPSPHNYLLFVSPLPLRKMRSSELPVYVAYRIGGSRLGIL